MKYIASLYIPVRPIFLPAIWKVLRIMVVLIDSVSKRYSECGIRIGALITKNKEIRDAVMKFCQARLSPPLIGQIAAEASLDAPEEYSRETYDEYVERRKCLIDGLNRIPGVYSPIPMGAFSIQWPNFR